MTKETSYTRIKLLVKWVYDIAEEIENNTLLNGEDIMILLFNMKNIMSKLDTEVTTVLRENSQNTK